MERLLSLCFIISPAQEPDGPDGEDAVGAPGAPGQVGCQEDMRCKQPYNCAFVNKPSHGTRACLLEQQFENQENHVVTEVCRLPALPHSLIFLLPFLLSLSLLTEMATSKAGVRFCSHQSHPGLWGRCVGTWCWQSTYLCYSDHLCCVMSPASPPGKFANSVS